MDLKVDPDGLRADGVALAGSASQSNTAAPCQAAASDTVSTHVADVLTTRMQSLHTLMNHAGQLRVAGGLALTGTGNDLQSVDDTNAHHIAGVIDGAGTAPTSAPGAPSPSLPNVPTPTLPSLPSMNPLAPMTGEQVSALVHAGPGPASLRAFATHIRTTVAPAVMSTAQDVRNYGQSVHAHWDDGQTAAAKNVGDHADWLESTLHPHLLSVATAAESAAEHTDSLIRNTPKPQEFADLHQQLNVAMANFRSTGGRNAAQVAKLQSDLADKQSTALASYQTFAAAAPTTTAGAAPPAPAPPIVHAAGGQVEKLNETAHVKQDGPGQGKAHHGQGPGDEDSPVPTNAPPGTPTGTPPASVAPAAAADQAAPGMVANVAGMIMGAGAGAAGQVANSLHGLTGGGSPLSALSSLSSLPGLGGMPHMDTPQLPGGPGDGNGGGAPEGDPTDFGTGGTSPASGGGGDGGGGAPLSSSSPAVGPSVGTGITAGTPGGGTPGGGGPGGGGMPMMPPMMGGMGGKSDEARKSDDRRRVVLRPVANTEPVFGEVRQERRTRAERDKKKT